MRDNRIVKLKGLYLGNHSEINIKKPLAISNQKQINLCKRATPIHININTNNSNYINKSNLLKDGIKKIYVYNKHIKNIHEKEKGKIHFIKLNTHKNKEKNKIDERPYDNRNKKAKMIKYKNIYNQDNENESNIINDNSFFNDKYEDRNKTPEKKSIFNQVNPNMLMESFKKELENKEKMEKIKNNIIKKSV